VRFTHHRAVKRGAEQTLQKKTGHKGRFFNVAGSTSGQHTAVEADTVAARHPLEQPQVQALVVALAVALFGAISPYSSTDLSVIFRVTIY
jgi:hypothetical protein